jgi:hypothetical protein
LRQCAAVPPCRRAEVVGFGSQHIRDSRIRIDRVHGTVTPKLQAACDAMPKGQLCRQFARAAMVQGWPRERVCKVGHAGRPAGELPPARSQEGWDAAPRRERGATGHEIMAVSGHHKLAMVEHDTADADRRKLADRAIMNRIANKSGKP